MVFLIWLLPSSSEWAQEDVMWSCGGWSSIMDFRIGDTVISPIIQPRDLYMYTSLSLSTLYMPKDSILYISNGINIANTKHEKVAGCELLVDSIFRAEYRSGFTSVNFTLLLPKNEEQFYTINRSGDGSQYDPYRNLMYHKTYYGVIDVSDSSNGKVIQSKIPLKNELQATTTLLSATRHANGRDFWIVEKDWKGNTYFVYRTSPDTIVLDHIQVIGDSTGEWDTYGSGTFNTRGDRLGFSCFTQFPQLFDFDRCTGQISNPMKLKLHVLDRLGDTIYRSLDTAIGYHHINFSPSGRYLYLNTLWRIEQYDLSSGNVDSIAATRYIVDEWDSAFYTQYQTNEPFAESLVAVNNKMYFSLYNPPWVNYLHVIHSPDSAGAACGYKRSDFELGMPDGGSPLPNIAYYSLKKIVDSPCDTIGKVEPPKPLPLVFSLFPNPSRGSFSTASPAAGELYLYDAMGRLVKRINIIAGTQQHSIDLPAGLYVASVKFGERKETLRVVVW